MFNIYEKVVYSKTKELGVVHGIKLVKDGIKYQVVLPTKKKWLKQKNLIRAE